MSQLTTSGLTAYEEGWKDGKEGNPIATNTVSKRDRIDYLRGYARGVVARVKGNS